jgi:hypothetical protein
MRLAKEKTSHKIDVVIALAMAALAAVEQGQHEVPLCFEGWGVFTAPRNYFGDAVYTRDPTKAWGPEYGGCARGAIW